MSGPIGDDGPDGASGVKNDLWRPHGFVTRSDHALMRRTKLTEDLISKATALKEDGLNNVDIAAALDIAESTFYRWLQNPNNKLKRAFSEAIKKAEANYKKQLLTTIRDAATKQASYWTAAAWLLERKYPNEYGKADRRVDATESAAPTIVLGVTVQRAQNKEQLELPGMPNA